MHRRVLAIALPLLPVELARAPGDSPEACLGVLDAARHPTLTSLDRAAATLRLDSVSPAAWREGIRPGQTLASATAKLASLELRLLPAGAMEGALVRLTEAFLALSPQVAPCMHPHGAVVLLDAGGLLVHDADAREAELARAMLALAAELGHHGRVAVADGPWAAEALARYGKGAGFFRKNQVFHAPWRASGPLLARLPVAAIGLGEAHEAWLAGLGLHTLGELAEAPRRELTVRLGAEAKRALDRLAGVDSDPLPVFHLEESPCEAHAFEDECVHLEAMLFALRGLTSKLAARLFGRGVAARALVLTFRGAPSGVRDEGGEGDGEGDGEPPGEGAVRGVRGGGARRSGEASASAACGDAVGEAQGEGGDVVARVRVELPSALHRAEDLFAVVRARLGSLRLRAPVRSLALAAELLAPRMDSSGHLFQAFDRGEAALPRVLGELEAHHGAENVGFLQVAEAWRPDDRSRLVPASARPNGTSAPRAAESFPLLQPFEPLRVFARAVPVEPLEVVASYMHLEGAEWWRYGDEALVLEAAKGGEGVLALVERGEGTRAAAALAANENAGVHAGAHAGAHGGARAGERITASAHPKENPGVMRLWGWFG